MKEKTDFVSLIRSYGLQPATKRDFPLLTISCISNGYSRLRPWLGFSYEAIGALGIAGTFHSLLNEPKIAALTESFVEKNAGILESKLFPSVRIEFESIRKKLDKTRLAVDSNPCGSLAKILEFYPDYLKIIGFYNCFWRYIGNEKSRGRLSAQMVESISKEREAVARLYPEIEKIIQECAQRIGEQDGFDGALLQYLTFRELSEYLNGNYDLNQNKNLLLDRKKEYVYLFTEKDKTERIATGHATVAEVRKTFFEAKNADLTEIKGFGAFQGTVQGAVFNLQSPQSKNSALKAGNILVTSMTHPKDTALIQKSKAIVTDEGGILCHAAIVSRELKIPCVIGTKIGTQALRSGDWVEVDAFNGIVKVLRRK